MILQVLLTTSTFNKNTCQKCFRFNFGTMNLQWDVITHLHQKWSAMLYGLFTYQFVDDNTYNG